MCLTFDHINIGESTQEQYIDTQEKLSQFEDGILENDFHESHTQRLLERKEELHFILAYEGDDVVGYACFEKEKIPDLGLVQYVGRALPVHILPDYQKKGYGSMLMDELYDVLIGEGAESFFLIDNADGEDNMSVISWFVKKGIEYKKMDRIGFFGTYNRGLETSQIFLIGTIIYAIFNICLSLWNFSI